MEKINKLIDKETFKAYITATYALNESDFDRLMEDLNYFYELELKAFIRIRHLELKSNGMKNDQIYQTLKLEINERRFKGETLSERQIRRIIYG
jgi:hypothetical protein